MILIVEGPDGAGKTTLAEAIARKYELNYHHEGPPPAGADPLVHYLRMLFEADAAPGGAVFDRFALGEAVYGPILRGRDGLGPGGLALYERVRRRLKAIEVVCLPPFDACRAAWDARRIDGREMIVDDRAFRRSYDAWARLALDQALPKFDWTRGDAPEDLCSTTNG